MTAVDTLIIVPTKGRPEGMRRLLESLRVRTAQPFDLLMINSPGEFYHGLFSGFPDRDDALHDVWYITPPEERDSYAGKLAEAADFVLATSRWKYISVLNDDHEVITPGWDAIFKDAIGDEPFGLAYGPDGVWEEGQVPSAPFLTRSFVETLGWIALPGLRHILIDNVWMDLAKAVQACHFLTDVRIQHHHLDNGEAEPDATYAETQNNEPRNQADREVWWAWLDSEDRETQEQMLAALWTPPREITRPTGEEVQA